MDQTSVYIYRTAGGEVLYVGMSISPFTRERDHRADKDMTRVSSISLEWFDTRGDAAEREA